MSNQFQTFFQRTQAASSTPEITQRLYPVLKAEKILSVKHREKLLKEIRLLVHLSTEKFRVHYQELIDNFSEFVQLLPHPLIKAFQRDAGILDYALERALITLQIHKDYKLPPEVSSTHTEEEQEQLWTYALLSATLLYQIGEQLGYYRVHLFNHEKEFTTQWQPYTGPMLNLGEYYKYWLVSSSDATQYRTTTSLLARQLMPEAGFAWLVSHPKLFNMWLAMLDGDPDTAGLLAIIHSTADEKLSRRKKKNLLGEIISLDDELFSEADELDQAEDTRAGEAFLAWLIQGIEDKSISINQNDSFVHIVDKGIFLLRPEIFQCFSNYSQGHFSSWMVVQKQFNALGFAKLSAQDYRFEQFFGKGETAPKEGMLIEDSRGLFFSNKNQQLSQHLKPVAYDLTQALEKKESKGTTQELTQEFKAKNIPKNPFSNQ